MFWPRTSADRPQTDTESYFFPENVKQEAREEPNPNHLNKLWCFKRVETRLKQGETDEFQVSSFRFQVEDLVPGPFGWVNRLSPLFTALCYSVLHFFKKP